MTKHIVKGDISFECDDCGEILDTETGNWDSAQNILRRNRWRVRQSGGAWEHSCDSCSSATKSGKRK